MSKLTDSTQKEEHPASGQFICDGHELRFLIGSIFVEQMSSTKKILVLPGKIPTIWRLAKAAKRGSLEETDKGSGDISRATLDECLLHFNPSFQKESVRYEIGDILTEGMTSLKGAIRMPYSLFLVGRLALSSEKRGHLPVTMVEDDDLYLYESLDPFYFDDTIETEPGLIDQTKIDIDSEKAGSGLETDDIETEPGLLSDSGETQADRVWLETVLEKLGFRNTGVSIQNHIPEILRALPECHIALCKAEFEGNGDLAGIISLRENVEAEKMGSNINAYLARVEAVLKYSQQDFSFLPKARKPIIDVDLQKILYAVHMRGRYISNGYVTRTYMVMNILKKLEYHPEGVTRLGFPNDLAQFRHDKILETEEIEGHNFIALPDEGGGQLMRPVDELIQVYADRLVSQARQYKPFVLHAASNYLNGMAAIVAARQLGIPSIYEVRGIWEITQASHDESYQLTHKYRLQRNMENMAVKNADRIITISEPLKEFVIEHGANPDHVYVVPNGVDVDAFLPEKRDEALAQKTGIGHDKVVIGYVGSIVHYEGLDLLLEAVSQLPQEIISKVHVVIVGDGAALPQLKTLAEKLAIDDLCTFAGRVARAEVKSWYSLIDIAPFPRRSLAVTELVPPLKPYEAMAMEKAVLVSSVRALACEIEDGKTGVIFEKNNIDDLAKKLHILVKDQGLREKLGRVSGNWVSQERSIKALGRHM